MGSQPKNVAKQFKETEILSKQDELMLHLDASPEVEPPLELFLCADLADKTQTQSVLRALCRAHPLDEGASHLKRVRSLDITTAHPDGKSEREKRLSRY